MNEHGIHTIRGGQLSAFQGRTTGARAVAVTQKAKEVQIEGGVMTIIPDTQEEQVEIDEDDLFGDPGDPDKQIIARRATLDEYLEYTSRVEYINGRMITGPGVELFLGVEHFPKQSGRWSRGRGRDATQINQLTSAGGRQVMTEPKKLTTEEEEQSSESYSTTPSLALSICATATKPLT